MTDFSDFSNIRVEKTISENSTSSNFHGLIDNTAGRNKNTFSIGDSIEIYADISANPPTTKIFNGIIEDIDFQGKETRERIKISGRDYTARLQDRTVEPEVYTNLPAGSIVKDLIDKYTDDITVNNVDESPTIISRISFNHTPVYDAIKQLADLAEYYFYVDTNKDLHFEEKSTTSSGFTFNSGNTISASFKEERDSVFNEVWVYGDRYLDHFQENFTGDGTGSIFTLLYSPHNTEITVNGSIQKGGLLGVSFIPPSGTNYLVSYNDKQIVFVSGTTLGYSSIPANNGSVLIKYDRSLPIVKVGRNQASVNKYGKRILKITDKEIKDPDTAVQVVNQKLQELATPIKQGIIKPKNVLNITPGQTCIVDLPWHNINNQTFDVIEATYDITKSDMYNNTILSLKVNKKVPDVTDKLKDFETRIRKLESQDISTTDIITRLEYTTGSLGFRESGAIISTSSLTGSGYHLYATNFTPLYPFNLASGTNQGYLAGSFTGSASVFGPFIKQWSGGYF